MRQARIALLLTLLFSFSAHTAYALTYVPQIGNYTVAFANRTIGNATAYVDMVNQSSYLIFAPNLTQAYGYLAKAQVSYNKTPAVSVFYANQAVSSAGAQYSIIGQYRTISFAVMSVLTVASAFALAMSLMRARKRASRKG